MGCPGGRQRIALNSADKVFRDLRDLSFAAVGPQLGQRAKSIQSDYKTSKVAPVHIPLDSSNCLLYHATLAISLVMTVVCNF